MTADHQLAIYGSLAPGGSNHHHVAPTGQVAAYSYVLSAAGPD